MVLINEVWIGAGPSNYPGLALHLSPGTIDTFRGLPDARPGQRAAGDENSLQEGRGGECRFATQAEQKSLRKVCEANAT